MLAHGAFADRPPSLAAHVDTEAITLESVDALAPALVRDVRARLAGVARATVQSLANGRALKLLLPQPTELETPLAADRIVAFAGRESIRAAALERAAALRLYRLRGELHLERRRQLETLIDGSLLRAEARRRNVSPASLEASLAQVRPVTTAELRTFAASERAAGRPEPDPERARPYLEFHKRHERRLALLRELRERADIRIHLQAPPRPRLPVEPDGGVTLAAATGPVLVAYTNYRCSLCRATHRELDRLGAGKKTPRIVLRDFIPPGDSTAMQAAALARCAQRHGKLVPVRDALLGAENLPDLDAVARLVGITPSALRACARSPEVQRQIERDTQAALRIGFEAPPAFVADGFPLSGMQTAEQLHEALAGSRSEH